MNAKPTLTLEVVAYRKAMRRIAEEMANKEVYTVMPDCGGAYAWRKDRGLHPAAGVGVNSAGFGGWGGEYTISELLQQDFADWQSEFESAHWHEDQKGRLPIAWNDYHLRGLDLARRLKVELGEDICVVYEKPTEDPDCDADERREVLLNGNLVPLPSRRDLEVLFPDKDDDRQ